MANVKHIFHNAGHFFSNPARKQALLEASIGGSCERWLSAELFRAGNWHRASFFRLPRGEYIEPEAELRDLSVASYPDGVRKLHQVIEVKAVYSPGTLSKVRPVLEDLKNQLEMTKEKEREQKFRRTGIVFSIWRRELKSPIRPRRGANDYDAREVTKGGFFERVGSNIDSIFFSPKSSIYTRQRSGLVKVAASTVRWGEWEYDVDVRMTYFTKEM